MSKLQYFWFKDADAVKSWVRLHPENAQQILDAEYKRHPRPRYGLCIWLKRHRLHNPTTRVIRNR